VKRTADDGLSPNSQELAVVTGQTGARQVMVNRSAYSNFADGLQVQFIDNKTGFPVVTANVTAQAPAYSTALPAFGSAVTLTLDQDIPKLALGDPMVFADPAFRGSGLVIENNLVEDLLFARGVSLWGIIGGTVQGNVIRRLLWSAINPGPAPFGQRLDGWPNAKPGYWAQRDGAIQHGFCHGADRLIGGSGYRIGRSQSGFDRRWVSCSEHSPR
jgi:hypothetical protein